MKKHPVVICSNLTNRYGFRVLASGIKLDAYTKNPIILYSHQRPNQENPKILPIGKMHNVRINAEGQLVGDMEFDQDDDFAVAIEKKWEKGMLNAVSLKAEILQVSDEEVYKLPGQTLPSIIESLLEEVSVEPVPGDSNAVSLRLHYQGKPAQVISLSNDSDFDPSSLFPTTKPISDMKLIQLAFAGQKFVTLGKDATEEQIAQAVSDLAAKANESADKVVTLSAQVTEKDTLISTLQNDLQTIQLQAVTDKATALVDEAVTAKKITPAEKAEYVELAKTNYDTVKKILDNKKGFYSVAAEAGKTPEAGVVDYATLSFDEIDRKGLMAKLKAENVELYKAKFKERFGVEPKL
jgi:hypothetical protein